MSMGGGSSSGTTVQKSEPWDEQKPYLEYGFDEAKGIYQGGPADYFPGNTYVEFSDPTVAGLTGQVDKASQGLSDVSEAASNYAASTLGGGSDNPYGSFLTSGGLGTGATASGAYLNSNPYLDAAFDQAANKLTTNFQDSVLPNVAAQFGASGGAGGALHREMLSKMSGELGDSLAELGTGIYGQNYQAERDRQEAANANLLNTGVGLYGTGVNERMALAGLSPDLASAEYMPYQQLQDAGAQYEQYEERALEDEINRFNYEQNAQLASLQDYMAMISGNYGATSTSRTTSGGGSPLATGLGAATLIGSFF